MTLLEQMLLAKQTPPTPIIPTGVTEKSLFPLTNTSIASPPIAQPDRKKRKEGGYLINPIDTLSHTSIATFAQCQRKFFYSYVAGIPSPSNQFFVFGGAISRTLENWYKLKMDLDVKGLKFDQIKTYGPDIFSQFLDEKQREESENPAGIKAEDGDMSTDTMYRLGQVLLASYGEFHMIGQYPLHTEKEFLLDIGADIPIKGYIDLMYTPDQPNLKSRRTIIADHKTARDAYGSDRAPGEFSQQLAIYAASQNIRDVEYHLLIKGSGKTVPVKSGANVKILFGRISDQIMDNWMGSIRTWIMSIKSLVDQSRQYFGGTDKLSQDVCERGLLFCTQGDKAHWSCHGDPGKEGKNTRGKFCSYYERCKKDNAILAKT